MKKYKHILLTLSLLTLFATSINRQAVILKGNEEPETLAAVLGEYDHNYKRTTEIYWSATAYNQLQQSGKNAFPFTTTRTTLFIENGLYMFSNSEEVNSGYYTKASETNQMRHYVIAGGNTLRDDEEALLSEDKFSGNVNVNEYYVNLHTINSDENINRFTSLFTLIEDGETTYWSATNLDQIAMTLKDLSNNDISITLANAFMYFTAPTYTNPILDGDEKTYFTFKEARIAHNSSDELIFSLYANETSKLQNEETSLFARAIISEKNTTTIKALNKFIAN